MNNWIKRLCTAAFFPAALTCILLALWLFPPAVPVDNITPAELSLIHISEPTRPY